MANFMKNFCKVYILFFVLFLICFHTSALAKMVSIKGNDVNLRTGPGINNSVKYEYGEGFPLKILSTKGEWYKVSDFEGDKGWIHKNLVSSTPHMIVKANKGTTKKINVRSGPSTKDKIVAQAYYGVVFKTIKQQSGWAKVKHDSGVEGWVKRTLLWGF